MLKIIGSYSKDTNDRCDCSARIAVYISYNDGAKSSACSHAENFVMYKKEEDLHLYVVTVRTGSQCNCDADVINERGRTTSGHIAR